MASRMELKITCQELERVKLDAVSACLDARKIRRSRDVSIYEDAELCREAHQKIYALIRHLLIGHDGRACPAGERPIVKVPRLRSR